MKRCPECQRTYSDDTLQFCLEDGAALISEGAHSADETLVLNTPPSSTDDQELAITKEASSKETRAKTEPASAAQVRKSSPAPKSACNGRSFSFSRPPPFRAPRCRFRRECPLVPNGARRSPLPHYLVSALPRSSRDHASFT